MMEYPFPLGYFEDFIDIISHFKDIFEVITYRDLDWIDDADKENFYPKERAQWLKYRDPNKIYLIIQHDLDSGIQDAIDMLNYEKKHQIKSVIMVLIDPINSRLVKNINKFNTYPCPIDIPYLSELEKKFFFEIGYHGNAYERSHFNVELAREIFRADLKYLRKHFSIQSYCPHGGPIDFNGRSNGFIDLPPEEKNRLKWVLIDYRIQFDGIFSDGGHYGVKEPDNCDLRDFIKAAKPGGRYLIHIHPCYYARVVTPSSNFSGTHWYEAMLKFYRANSTKTSFWNDVKEFIEDNYATQ
ncbi:MAG: hypothetical protein H7A01_07085 [Hahellaceae bacterium]|nr:hypothetical protein [Hahellaceae bacterium]MCP5211721.1 hypothetical protein [Hahellaceae bacterium]